MIFSMIALMASCKCEKTFIILGSIVHCKEAFSVHTMEKGFIIVKGKKVNTLYKYSFFWTMLTLYPDTRRRLRMSS